MHWGASRALKTDDFLLKTDDFLLKTDDFLLKTDDFLLKNVDFIIKKAIVSGLHQSDKGTSTTSDYSAV